MIVSSTRRGRVGREVTDAVVQRAQERVTTQFGLIDLRDVALPWLDEPYPLAIPPAMGKRELETTKGWAARVAALDAALIVTAEDNGGYPGTAEERPGHRVRGMERLRLQGEEVAEAHLGIIDAVVPGYPGARLPAPELPAVPLRPRSRSGKLPAVGPTAAS